jgi:hypothetical protein
VEIRKVGRCEVSVFFRVNVKQRVNHGCLHVFTNAFSLRSPHCRTRFLTMTGQSYARLNAYNGPKRQILGNQAGRAAPAWKTTNGVPPPGTMSSQGVQGKGKHAALEQGSKIFLSKLPLDVDELEVEVSTIAMVLLLCVVLKVARSRTGAVQEDCRSAEGVLFGLQPFGELQGDGGGHVCAARRCSHRSEQV